MNNPVERFLVTCLRARWDPAALEEARALVRHSDVDWDALSRIALEGRLAPLLHLVLRDHMIISGPLKESLSYAYYYCGARNAIVLHELRGVLAALAKENIRVILLKGAALVERVYHNAAVRPMGDIDLLVPRQKLERAVGALRASYRVPGRIGTFAGANVALAQVSPGNPGYGRIAFDLNCFLIESPYFSHMRFVDWLWATAMPGEIGGCPVLELTPEALILHLSAHLLMDQKGKQLLWLHDIAEVLVLYREQLHWDVLFENARRFDLVLPLRQVLLRLEQDWRVAIPKRWEQSLNDSPASSTERRFYAWFASKDQPRPPLFPINDSGRQKALTLGYLWDNLMPQPAYMSERYQIGGKWLLPLTYPHRWYRGMRSALLESLPRRLRSTFAVGQV